MCLEFSVRDLVKNIGNCEEAICVDKVVVMFGQFFDGQTIIA